MKIKPTLLIPLLALSGSATLAAQDAQGYFDAKCTACHTIGGGRLIGPDLLGVSERQSRDWLVEFIVDPASKLKSGDEYAQKILAESNGIPMVALGTDAAMAGAILDLIDSKGGETTSPAEPIEFIPFTAAEVQGGEALFMGAARFTEGAPACVSCHTVSGVGGFGGGRLGPDLTQVFSRLGGERGLTAWLGSPASAVMTPIFKDKKMTDTEIRQLIAFFDSKTSEEESPAATASFFYSGLGAAALLLLLFGFLWRNRYNATRTPMVERAKR